MRIWVTGVGIVSPLGTDAQSTMQALCEGRRAFRQVTLFPVEGHRSQIAAEVSDPCFVAASQPLGWSRTGAFAVRAGSEALAQAGLSTDKDRIALAIGSTTGPLLETEQYLPALAVPGAIPPALATLLSHPLAGSVDFVARTLGPFERVRTLSSACSTGANAILLAALWIASGQGTRVLAGAADALCLLTFSGFNALGSLDPQGCRPFDRSRAGLSLGEGAAFLVLERDDVAAQRGARPLAELAGWCAAAEAHHITNPEPEATTAARVMTAAMLGAGLAPSAIDYVNAHGTATPLNDVMEIRALRNTMGAELDRIAVSSTKGQIGHCLGAAGAIEAAATVLAIAASRIPPTAGLSDPDPACEANHVRVARDQRVRAALTNSFGFGGLDTTLVFTEPAFGPERAAKEPRKTQIAGAAILGAPGLFSLSNANECLASGPSPSHGAIAADPSPLLDAARSRRLGRAERMLCVAVGSALSAVDPATTDGGVLGLVVGQASGGLDSAGRFLRRVQEKGPRFAPPADFPNLMLSGAAGHASIYHALRGPVLCATDLGVSVASALMTAIDFLEVEAVDCLLAAGAQEANDAQLAALQATRGEQSAPLTEGASCLLVAPEGRGHGVPILWRTHWYRKEEAGAALSALPRPKPDARVVTAGMDSAGLLANTSWKDVSVAAIESRCGWFEGVDGAALAAAASLVSAQSSPQVLALIANADHGYAFVFGVP